MVTNDVITKNKAKFGPPQNQRNYHSKGFDKSYPKMNFLLNLSYCVKRYGHFCQILALFTMSTHQQIRSCHVTQVATFENFKYCPHSIFNIKKSHKISSRKVLYCRSHQPKTSRGMETPQCLQG